MGATLKDLPEDIRKIAVKRYREQTFEPNENLKESALLASLFFFYKTPEGFKYWYDINKKYTPRESKPNLKLKLNFNTIEYKNK